MLAPNQFTFSAWLTATTSHCYSDTSPDLYPLPITYHLFPLLYKHSFLPHSDMSLKKLEITGPNSEDLSSKKNFFQIQNSSEFLSNSEEILKINILWTMLSKGKMVSPFTGHQFRWREILQRVKSYLCSKCIVWTYDLLNYQFSLSTWQNSFRCCGARGNHMLGQSNFSQKEANPSVTMCNNISTYMCRHNHEPAIIAQ